MSIRISFLKVSEFFFCIMLLYFEWFSCAFFEIPYMMFFTGAGMIGFLALHYYLEDNRMIVPISEEYIIWLLFFIYSFVFGLLVNANFSVFISSIGTSFEYLIIGYAVFLIAAKEKNLDLFINAFLITSVIAAATTILFPVEVPHDPGRYTMGLNSNANSLGITMMIGIFCALYKINFKSLPRTMLLFILIGLMTYTIFLTGSRKSLLVLALLLVFWSAFSLPKTLRLLPDNKKSYVLGIMGVFILISCLILVPLYLKSTLAARLTLLISEGSTDNRIPMYKEAIFLFLQNPILGIGFGQFSVVSEFNTYSHSTFAEVLSCTGLLGTVLYFAPYPLLFIKLFTKLKNLREKHEDQYAYQWLALLLILLLLAFVVIHFYDIDSYIVFGMIIAFANLNLQNSKCLEAVLDSSLG